MNEIEQTALHTSAVLWSKLLHMHVQENLNDDILKDFRYHIHAIQALIMARPEIRKEKLTP